MKRLRCCSVLVWENARPHQWKTLPDNFSPFGMRSNRIDRRGKYFWPQCRTIPGGLIHRNFKKTSNGFAAEPMSWRKRANALHSPLWAFERMSQETIVMPIIGFGHVRAKKLFEKNLLSEYRWCRDASLALTQFAGEIRIAVTDWMLPWPDQPKWPKRRRPKSRARTNQKRNDAYD
jgi:hypothetical protein